jgi:hypothetical protein
MTVGPHGPHGPHDGLHAITPPRNGPHACQIPNANPAWFLLRDQWGTPVTDERGVAKRAPDHSTIVLQLQRGKRKRTTPRRRLNWAKAITTVPASDFLATLSHLAQEYAGRMQQAWDREEWAACQILPDQWLEAVYTSYKAHAATLKRHMRAHGAVGQTEDAVNSAIAARRPPTHSHSHSCNID